jgi:hypothetical protein
MRTQSLTSYVATAMDAYRRMRPGPEVASPEVTALLVLAGAVAQAGERLVHAARPPSRPTPRPEAQPTWLVERKGHDPAPASSPGEGGVE